MKYEIYSHDTDSVVGYAESLEAAEEVAALMGAMGQDCEIREIPEFYNPMHLHQVQNSDAFASITKQPNEKEKK